MDHTTLAGECPTNVWCAHKLRQSDVPANALRCIFSTLYCRLGYRYKVEYSESPFYNEAQALTVSCESEEEVQVITTNATAIPEVQLVHLKMDDGFSTSYPGSTVYEVQASARGTRFSVNSA